MENTLTNKKWPKKTDAIFVGFAYLVMLVTTFNLFAAYFPMIFFTPPLFCAAFILVFFVVKPILLFYKSKKRAEGSKLGITLSIIQCVLAFAADFVFFLVYRSWIFTRPAFQYLLFFWGSIALLLATTIKFWWPHKSEKQLSTIETHMEKES